MVPKELLDYMRLEITKGTPMPVIRSGLEQNGWTRADIDEALHGLNPISSAPTPPPSFTPVPPPMQTPNVPLTQSPAAPAFESAMAAPGSVHTSKHAKKHKSLVWGVVIVILLLVGAAVGYGYYSGFLVSLDALPAEAFTAARAATSASFDTTISIDGSALTGQATQGISLLPGIGSSRKGTLTLKGTYDVTNPDAIKFQSAISFEIGSLAASFEVRATDGTLYAEMTKSPGLSFFPMLGQYENKWYSFPYKGKDLPSTLPIMPFTGIDASKFKSLTQDEKDHILALTNSAHFITITKKLPIETINDEASYHFLFDLDRDGITNYITAVESYIHDVGKNDSYLSSFNVGNTAQFLQRIKNWSGEAWIGRNDHLPRKMMVSFDAAMSDTQDLGDLKISLTSIFKDWNTPTAVEAPSESAPIESLFAASMNDAQMKGKDASIKANLSNFRAEAELFYSNNHNVYSGICASAALAPLIEDIKMNLGSQIDFTCKSAAATYAAGAKLNDGTYFCVDSTGYANTAKSLPTLSACPK